VTTLGGTEFPNRDTSQLTVKFDPAAVTSGLLLSVPVSGSLPVAKCHNGGKSKN
jgi:hypothetical protein